MKRMFFIYVLASMGLGACSEINEKPPTDEEELAALADEILAIIGNGTCDSAESCTTIAFGSKPCGGPWSYLVYCADTVDEADLIEKVEAHAEKEHAYNVANEIVSDCSVEQEPEVDLVDGVCVAINQ